jgi:hypothetical protein
MVTRSCPHQTALQLGEEGLRLSREVLAMFGGTPAPRLRWSAEGTDSRCSVHREELQCGWILNTVFPRAWQHLGRWDGDAPASFDLPDPKTGFDAVTPALMRFGHKWLVTTAAAPPYRRFMKTALALVVVTLAALLGSCGSDSEDAPEKSESSSTWSLERAEKEWAAFAVRYEAGFAPVDLLEGSEDVSAYNEACEGFADALRVNAEKASTGKWPGELKGKMDRFADLLEQEARAVDVCSEAETIKDVEEGLRLQRRDSAGSAGAGIDRYFEEQQASGG